MSRKRRNKHRRRFRKFHAKNMESLVKDSFKYENHKTFLKGLEKEELLKSNRTVFVTNVKNLNIETNVKQLQLFFQTRYGEIEECVVIAAQIGRRNRNHNRRPPCAKITFRYLPDAKLIFDKSLEEARKDGSNAFKLIRASIAYHGRINPGFLKVRPAEVKSFNHRTNIHEGEGSLSNSFMVSSVSLGHWVPPGEDNGVDILNDTEYGGSIEESEVTEFIEEFIGFNGSKIIFNLKQRILQIQVTVNKDVMFLIDPIQYSITFRLKQLQSSINFGYEDECYSILFNCVEPPKLERRINEDGSTERVTSIGNAPFGRCFGYKLILTKYETLKIISTRNNFLNNLIDFGVLKNGAEDLDNAVQLVTRRVTFGTIEKSEIESCLKNIPNRKLGLLLCSILDKGKINWFDALHDKIQERERFLSVFEIINTACLDNVDNARTALCFVAEMPRSTRFPSKVIKVLLSEDDTTLPIDIPHFCIEIPRIIITPTRKIVSGFDIEMSNRVLRHFLQSDLIEEDFMRITLCDENESKLFGDDFKSPEISKRVEKTIMNGICVNGRKYKFLAYSSSQLKECSVWMVNCSDNDDTVLNIRKWMGDFTEIRIPSKFAARMGQCFSTTIQTVQGNVTIEKENCLLEVNTVQDMFTFSDEGGTSCHSDGTGLIQKDVMAKIVTKMPSLINPQDVSIIQVRFGGAKGTLTAWDNLEILGRSDVCLRQSMIKFSSPYRHLEVVKVGRHIPYYLNRQMIMLLGVHGVPQSIFLDMQKTMLETLNGMMSDRKKAIEILPLLGGSDKSVQSSMMHMLACGFGPETDPFLFSCLHAIRNHHLIHLRKKSRIHVQNGAVLMGGLDETRSLPDGCVFIQLKRYIPSRDKRAKSLSDYFTLTGPVLVAKHPVLHPGDVRMLLAVDVPELQSHKNMILFSQHGKRAEPDKMSGSDLDGDEFAVTWDERLFLKNWNSCIHLGGNKYKVKDNEIMEATYLNLSVVNHDPMNFDTQGSALPVATITDKHLIDHFINFSKADTLGRISMLWLDYAAKSKESARCLECLQLAELHSIAVDFSKSGIPAVIPQELILHSSEPRPHWRDKKGSPSYHCSSTIGQLYDDVVIQTSKVNELNVHGRAAIAGRTFNKQGQLLCFVAERGYNALDSQLKRIYNSELVERLGLITSSLLKSSYSNKKSIDQTAKFICFAKYQRYSYEDEILSLMNKYKIYSEGELLTGCISKYHKLNKRRQHDVAEEVRRQCNQLRDKYRVEFIVKVMSHVVSLDHLKEQEHDRFIEWVDNAVSSPHDKVEERLAYFTKKVKEEGVNIFFGLKELYLFRVYGQKYAAAYYLVTYNPQIREIDIDGMIEQGEGIINDLLNQGLNPLISGLSFSEKRKESHALFSFPHIVYDVLNVGLCEQLNTEVKD